MHNTGVHEPCRPPLSAKADISPTPWGNLPQRRKRIFLVADFDGRLAGKILFESEGDSPQCGEMSRSDRGDGTVRVSGYSAESLRAWQRTAGSAADSFGTAGLCLCDQGGERIDILKERTATLRAEAHHPPCVLENHPADSRLQISENGKVQTLTSRCGTGGGNVPLLMDTPKTLKIRCGKAGGGKGSLIQENKSATLSCNNDQITGLGNGLAFPDFVGTGGHELIYCRNADNLTDGFHQFLSILTVISNGHVKNSFLSAFLLSP